MHLTLFTDYSLRTLMYVYQNSDKKVTKKEIAKWYNISEQHLASVVHMLAKKKYIITFKGNGGGMMPNADPSSINIGKLIAELDGNMNIAECFDIVNNKCRITNNCKLKHILAKAANEFRAVLEQYTLQDILLNDIGFDFNEKNKD